MGISEIPKKRIILKQYLRENDQDWLKDINPFI